MPPILSIIVPVYNRAHCIKACVHSVLSSPAAGYELLLCDDCSTDDSFAISSALAKDNPCVFAYRNEKNLGPGPTRNFGITKARGKYLAFLDSDDTLHTPMLTELFSLFASYPEAEIFAFNHQEFLLDGTVRDVISIQQEGLFSADAFLSDAPGTLTNALWRFVFQTALIRCHHIVIPDTVFAEDFAFVSLAFLYANKVYACPKPFYHYQHMDNQSLGLSAAIAAKEKGFTACMAYLEDFVQNNPVSMEKAFAINSAVYTMYMLDLSAYLAEASYHEQMFPLLPVSASAPFSLNLAFYQVHGIQRSSARYLWSLFVAKISQFSANFQNPIYFCPAGGIALSFAKQLSQLKQNQLTIRFLDNHCSMENPLVRTISSLGFSVYPYSHLDTLSAEERHCICFAVCHWSNAAYKISMQLEGLGFRKDEQFLCGLDYATKRDSL